MRGKLERRLLKLENNLVKMGSAVEDLIKRAMRSIEENDDKVAVKVVEKDYTVDNLETDIEKRCISLIALQQPIAGDLREITSILKIITDLERIGDYCVNIAKIQIQMKEKVSSIQELKKMSNLSIKMLRESINSFIDKDSNLARKTAQLDKEMDDMYEELYKSTLSKLINKEINEEAAIAIFFIGRYYERIGDHVTNICERIIYVVDGIRERCING